MNVHTSVRNPLAGVASRSNQTSSVMPKSTFSAQQEAPLFINCTQTHMVLEYIPIHQYRVSLTMPLKRDMDTIIDMHPVLILNHNLKHNHTLVRGVFQTGDMKRKMSWKRRNWMKRRFDGLYQEVTRCIVYRSGSGTCMYIRNTVVACIQYNLWFARNGRSTGCLGHLILRWHREH